MAHNPHTKARALVMLLTGDAPQYVAKRAGVPYATIKRWQQQTFADVATVAPELAGMVASVAEIFPGLLQ